MKIWLITGASRGLGAEFARAALESGDSVVATSRSAESVTKALGASENLLPFSLDVTRRGDAEKAVDAALKRFGRIDVLVNNAGYGLAGALEECSAEENAGVSAYCGTKFAVEGLSEALAKEVEPLGIRVTIVEPGYFRTELLSAGAMRFAAKEIEDYAATAGAVRLGIAAMHGKQEGDPRKLAVALVRIVNDANPPLRFLAGADAVREMEAKLDSSRMEIERWRELSSSLAYGD